MIHVKNISKAYNGKKVVDGVTINIPKGKITSLIEPIGAGKSTVISIMSRLMKRDRCVVLVDGKAAGGFRVR